jgi:hypothetical protein
MCFGAPDARLKLLLEKYRDGELNLDVFQAFTLTDAQNAQEEIWEQLEPWDRNLQTVLRLRIPGDVNGAFRKNVNKDSGGK